MKRKKGWRTFRAAYFILLAAFTAWIALDTFVIPHTYAAGVSGRNASSAASSAVSSSRTSAGTSSASSAASSSQASSGASSSASSSASSAVSTGTTYSGGGVTITVTTCRVDDTDVYVADVTLDSADLLATAFASDTYGRNIKAATSVIAEENDAILAINGDFYGSQTSGYVIRNGVLYRSKAYSADREDLVIYQDGSFGIIREGDVTAQELLDSGAEQVLSFGPALVENGAVAVDSGDEVAKAMTSNPRTAIGIVGDLHYVFVVADGRTSASAGLSLKELADFMCSELGCTTAYNLDGGGSSTMVFNGSVINNPTSGGSIKERSVSDIVYIRTA